MIYKSGFIFAIILVIQCKYNTFFLYIQINFFTKSQQKIIPHKI